MEKLNIGGQAVIEGVLIRSPRYFSIAVRKPDDTITIKRETIKSAKSKLVKVPVIRGMVALYEALSIGLFAIIHSANEASLEEDKMSKKEMALTIVFSLAMALLLFVGLPYFITSLVTKNGGLLFNIIDGILRAAIFIIYLLLISLMPDVRTMFQYHGAEHMTIHAYEAGLTLNKKEVRKFQTMHPRCGTSFLLFVLLLSIVAFSLITSQNTVVKIASRIVLIPIIGGASYEVLKFSAKHKNNPIFKAVVYPGLMLQKITTKQPTDKQIEVAIYAMKDIISAEGA